MKKSVKKKSKSFLPALGVLVGTEIGAGFLGIPYVVSKSGFLVGVLYLFLIASFILLLKLCLGEVILRTDGNHQLTGYAEKYLGKWGKLLMLLAMIFGIFPALTAYLIAEGQTLSYVFTGGLVSAFYFSILFFALMACLSYIGLRALKDVDKYLMYGIIGLVILIALMFFNKVEVSNLFYFNAGNLFLPVGVILFSFLAFSALPETKRLLRGNEKAMKKTIFLGVLIPLAVYLVFTFVVVGVFGNDVSEIATLALGRFSSILALITMFASFFASSIAMRDMFRFDFKSGRLLGWVIAISVPLVLFLIIHFFNLVSFIQLLSLAGVISAGLTGVTVLLMNLQAKKIGRRRPEYNVKMNWFYAILLIVIFIAAVILELTFG